MSGTAAFIQGATAGFGSGYNMARQVRSDADKEGEKIADDAKKQKLAAFRSELFNSTQPQPAPQTPTSAIPAPGGMPQKPVVDPSALKIPGADQRIAGMVQSAGGPAMPTMQPQAAPQEPKTPNVLGQMDHAMRIAFEKMMDPEYADIQPEILQTVDTLVSSSGRMKDLMYSEMRAKAKPDLMTLYKPGATPIEQSEALARLMSNYPDGRSYHAVVNGDSITLVDDQGKTTSMKREDLDQYVASMFASPDSMFETITAGIKERKEEAARQKERDEKNQDAKDLAKYKDDLADDGNVVNSEGNQYLVKGTEAMPITVKGTGKQLAADTKSDSLPNDQKMIEYMITPDEDGKTIAPDRNAAWTMLKSGTVDVPAVAQRMATAQFERQTSSPGEEDYIPYDQLYESAIQLVRKHSGAGGALPTTNNTNNEPVKISSDEEYNGLPSGTKFVAPDGTVRVKP